jgi:hypothetical protein
MVMRARQDRRLGGIEAELRASEPRLAAMFATFTRLHQVDGPVRRELISRSGFRVLMHRPEFIFFVVMAAMLVVGVVLGTTGHRSVSCQVGHGEHVTAQSLASCDPASGSHPAMTRPG